MDLALATVAEALACDFPQLRYRTVVRVLTECVEECPHGGPHFIEQAARARLSRIGLFGAPWPMTRPYDALDVSLHDNDLAAEVELTANLMVAANESDCRLTQCDIDRILGLAGRPVIPAQPSGSPRVVVVHAEWPGSIPSASDRV